MDAHCWFWPPSGTIRLSQFPRSVEQLSQSLMLIFRTNPKNSRTINHDVQEQLRQLFYNNRVREQLRQQFCNDRAQDLLGKFFYHPAMTDDHNNSGRVVFGGFDPKAEVEVTERNLPHWFQPGVAMFVTYRTADSLPREVLDRWQKELEAWLSVRELSKELAVSTVQRQLPNHDELLNQLSSAELREFKRLSDRLFHQSLDECRGACQLRRPELAQIVGDAILFHHETKYDLERFVVMPNHVHVIVQFRAGASLKTISQSWMRYTARKINAAIGGSGSFWQSEPFDHIIRSPKQFEYLQRYIADNPLKADLPSGDYLYWQRG